MKKRRRVRAACPLGTQRRAAGYRKARKGHVSAKRTLRVGAACPQDLRAACAVFA
ncbi:hypothetical protein NIES4073_46020 [Kalymmatonema gypsitolerans NIES-4073]|nr:hypothetical protein NIES4073_46020 [Scytonema sp. NIES-4073]